MRASKLPGRAADRPPFQLQTGKAMRRFGTLIGAVLALGAAAATTGSASAQEGDGIVVYNAQHESLTQEWADAFTNETGIKVTLRNGSDTRARQPDRRRKARFAGRRVPDRELAGDGPGRMPPACSPPVDADTLAQVPADYPSGRRQLDRHRRAQHRFAYDKTQAQAGRTAEVAARPRRPELEGPLGRIADAAPISRPSSARCWRSRAKKRPATWLTAMKDNVRPTAATAPR